MIIFALALFVIPLNGESGSASSDESSDEFYTNFKLRGMQMESSSASEPCIDIQEDCNLYNRSCRDARFVDWAETKCAHTCGKCGDKKPCEDTLDDCKFYDQSCPNPAYGVWAIRDCTRTCGHCGEADEADEAAEADEDAEADEADEAAEADTENGNATGADCAIDADLPMGVAVMSDKDQPIVRNGEESKKDSGFECDLGYTGQPLETLLILVCTNGKLSIKADTMTCVSNICTCENGTEATGKDCPFHQTEQCVDCNTGFQLNTDAENPEICEPIVSNCAVEANLPVGVAVISGKNQPIVVDGEESTTSVFECAAGYTIREKETPLVLVCKRGKLKIKSPKTMSCDQNECTCENGTPPMGAKCTSHEAIICIECGPGYEMNNDNSCKANECTCENGTPATEANCTEPGANVCATCNIEEGFHKNDDNGKCEPNKCTCENGDPATGEECTSHEAKICSNTCNEGFFAKETKCESIKASGENCAADGECDSNFCNAGGVCANPQGTKDIGENCAAAGECDSNFCISEKCAVAAEKVVFSATATFHGNPNKGNGNLKIMLEGTPDKPSVGATVSIALGNTHVDVSHSNVTVTGATQWSPSEDKLTFTVQNPDDVSELKWARNITYDDVPAFETQPMTFSVVLNSNGTELGKVENVVINLCPRGENYVLSPDEGACQKCTCNNGNGKVVCSEAVRTRKNLKDVSKEEFAKYASLVNKLKEGASKKEGIWADYEWIHRAADVHNIPTNGTDKVTIRPFFHWHRRFIYELETELIRLYYEETGSCDIAIPYFDSVSEEPRTSFVWSEDYFGSTNDGSTQNGDCEVTEVTNAGFSIPNGPFRHSGGCSGVILTRKWKTFEMAFETTKAYKSHLLDGEQNPLKWMENLEDLHVKVHAEVGGTMRNNAWSPRDPIFFSHHAYIDKLWADQQAQGGEWSTVEYATENKLRNLRVRNENGEKSVLWEDFYTLEDVQDTKMLKYKRGDPNWGVKYEETPQRMLAANKRPKWMKESGELEPFMQKHVEYMKRELKKLREEMMSIDSLEE